MRFLSRPPRHNKRASNSGSNPANDPGVDPARRLRLAAIAALIFAAGLGTGRWLAETNGPREPVGGAIHRAVAQTGGDPAGPSAAPPPAPTPQAVPGSPERGDAPGLAQGGEDPGEIFGAVIDALRDDEIIAALATVTDMSAEEVRDVRDPRALARRMSQIALGDLLGSPGQRPPGLAEVQFFAPSSARAGGKVEGQAEGTARGAQRKGETGGPFNGKQPVFARFARDDRRDDRVFMKWTRMKGPEIILFRPFPVSTRSEIAEIELRPESPLPPGLYKVAFYSADETMRPLASGHYSVAQTPPANADE